MGSLERTALRRSLGRRGFRVRPGGGGGSSDPLAGVSWAWRFEADSITGLVDGDPVQTWQDSSGYGRDAAQATSTRRPAWRANVFNGRSALQFDGTDDFLLTGQSAAVSESTFWLVGDFSAPSSASYLVDGVVEGARQAVYAFSDSSLRMWSGNSGPVRKSTAQGRRSATRPPTPLGSAALAARGERPGDRPTPAQYSCRDCRPALPR